MSERSMRIPWATIAAGVGLAVLWLPVRLVLEPLSPGMRIAWVAVGVAILIVLVAWPRFLRPRRVLVWLRRFTPAGEDPIRAEKLVTAGCAGKCIPVTLQDESVPFSTPWMLARGLERLLLWLSLFMIVGLVAVIGLVGLPLAIGLEPTLPALLFMLACAAALWFWLFHRFDSWALRFPGFSPLGPRAESVGEEVTRLVRRVKESRSPFSGAVVLACPEDCWREAVLHLLVQADAVLVDVSAPSRHVEWELEQIARHRGTSNGSSSRSRAISSRRRSSSSADASSDRVPSFPRSLARSSDVP